MFNRKMILRSLHRGHLCPALAAVDKDALKHPGNRTKAMVESHGKIGFRQPKASEIPCRQAPNALLSAQEVAKSAIPWRKHTLSILKYWTRQPWAQHMRNQYHRKVCWQAILAPTEGFWWGNAPSNSLAQQEHVDAQQTWYHSMRQRMQSIHPQGLNYLVFRCVRMLKKLQQILRLDMTEYRTSHCQDLTFARCFPVFPSRFLHVFLPFSTNPRPKTSMALVRIWRVNLATSEI